MCQKQRIDIKQQWNCDAWLEILPQEHDMFVSGHPWKLQVPLQVKKRGINSWPHMPLHMIWDKNTLVLVYLKMRGEGERWERQWAWSSLLFWDEADVQYKGVLILFILDHISKNLQAAGNLHARASIFAKWLYISESGPNKWWYSGLLCCRVIRVVTS